MNEICFSAHCAGSVADLIYLSNQSPGGPKVLYLELVLLSIAPEGISVDLLNACTLKEYTKDFKDRIGNTKLTQH